MNANVKYRVTKLPFCCISGPLHDLHTNWGRTNWHDNSAWVGTLLTFALLSDKNAASDQFTRRSVSPRSLCEWWHSTVLCHVRCLHRHGCSRFVPRRVRWCGQGCREWTPERRSHWLETQFLLRNTLYSFQQGCHHVVSQLSGWNWSQYLTL